MNIKIMYFDADKYYMMGADKYYMGFAKDIHNYKSIEIFILSDKRSEIDTCHYNMVKNHIYQFFTSSSLGLNIITVRKSCYKIYDISEEYLIDILTNKKYALLNLNHDNKMIAICAKINLYCL